MYADEDYYPVKFTLNRERLNIYKCLVNEKSKNGGTVILNVGGKIHQVRWETIDKFPRSRLQKIRYATSEGKG